MSREFITIQRRADEQFVDAELLTGLSPLNLIVIENEWQPLRSVVLQELLAASVPAEKWPQSLHWSWSRKAPQLKFLAATGFGVVVDKKWQGVMMTKTEPYKAKLGPDKGRPLVYVDFVEAAPWNWTIKEIGRMGEYRLVGSVLLWRAVQQSLDEGFHGRVGLHALPQSEGFYTGEPFGMTPIGRDPDKQNLLYLELTREQAQKALQSGESP